MIADAWQPTVKGSPRSYHDAVSCYEAINPFSSAKTRNEKGDLLPVTSFMIERTGVDLCFGKNISIYPL